MECIQKILKRGECVTERENLFEVAMALILKQIMEGIDDKNEISENVFYELLDMGFDDGEIETALDEIFKLQEFQDVGMFNRGISHVIYDLYSPARRVPVELLYDPEDDELTGAFKKLYDGSFAPDKFEIYVEGGENEFDSFDGIKC